jgi:hypothetical protein
VSGHHPSLPKKNRIEAKGQQEKKEAGSTLGF